MKNSDKLYRFTNLQIKNYNNMNCNWCPDQEDQNQKILPYSQNSSSLKDLMANNTKLKNSKANLNLQQNRISLKKPNDFIKTSSEVFYVPIKIPNNNLPIRTQKIRTNYSYQELHQASSTPLIASVKATVQAVRPFSYTTSPNTPKYMPSFPILKINQPRFPKALPNINIKYLSPKQLPSANLRETVRFDHQFTQKQSASTNDNNKSTINSFVQPIKVQWKQEEQTLPYKQLQILKQKKSQDKPLENQIKLIHFQDIHQNYIPKNNALKASQKQFKKLGSLIEPYNTGIQDQDRRNSITKSMRGPNHLEQIACKRTQSIANIPDDEEKQQFSQVIFGFRDLNRKRQQRTHKMTNSQTQISQKIQNKMETQKGSKVVWETSRKGSYYQV